MKKFIIIVLLCLINCSTNKNNYCINNNLFNILIINSNLSKITTKNVLNNIINNSSINFDENSNYLIQLEITVSRFSSLISTNNTSQIEDMRFIINYNFFDKDKNVSLDKGKFIIIDEVNVSDNRFANYSSNEYVMENISKNIAIRLENRVKMLLKNKKCL